jgi:hypothetical protein
MAVDQGDNLFNLRCACSFNFARGLGIGEFAASGLGNEVEMQRISRTVTCRFFPRRFGRRKCNAAAVIGREDLREGLIEPLNQPRRGAEIGREGNRVEEQRIVVWDFETKGFDARKKFSISVAEEVDGLHGVADHEAGAARPFWPSGDEAGEQLVLAAAGVLKLVDQQVADFVGDGESCVGGKIVFASEHALGNLRYLGEVHCACLCKGDSQFARCLAQQREAGLHDSPFVFGVADGRQVANGGKGDFKAGDGGKLCDQRANRALPNLPRGVDGKPSEVFRPFSERQLPFCVCRNSESETKKS